MLYLIGLGLGDAEDITVKGLEIVKNADQVYLEAYTSILTVGKECLEKFYGRDLVLADREFVEQNADDMLDAASEGDVAFLVVGDPLGATTHSDLILRAHRRQIKYKIVHNASIINAVACCGLQLYHFGEVVSIPFWTESWKPDSFFDRINSNLKAGLHTLCLLDIRVKERTLEGMMKNKLIYEEPRFMSTKRAAQQLLEIIKNKKNEEEVLLNEDSLAIGLARVGTEEQLIQAGSLQELADVDLGKPLHSLVIPGKLHPLEKEMLDIFTSRSK